MRSPAAEPIAAGAVVLRGFARHQAAALVKEVEGIAAAAPFRHMVTPGGWRMSAAMTSCGQVGWVTDKTGYRYAVADPTTGRPWPRMPERFRRLAAGAAATGGFPGFAPDACLINRYAPGARLSLHRDEDERDLTAPIVSVSLGLGPCFCSAAAGAPTGRAASLWRTAMSLFGAARPGSLIMASPRSPAAMIR